MISNVKKMAISIALFSNGTNAIVMEVASVVGLNLVSAVGVNLRGSLAAGQHDNQLEQKKSQHDNQLEQKKSHDNQLEQKKSGPLSEADIFKQKVAASGFDLFQQLAKEAMLKEQKNVFYSPLVMFANFLMVVQGTTKDSQSREDFMKFLGFKKEEDLDIVNAVETYLSIEEKLKDEDVSIANLVYASYVKPDYQTKMKKMRASANELEKDPNESVKQINKKVDELTGGKIKKLLDDGDITPLTIAVLVSTIFIEDDWKHPLKEVKETGESEKMFAANFVEKSKKNVPYIGTTVSFPYAQDICGAQAVKLPFQRKGDMLFLLPHEKGPDGLKTVVEKLAESSREKKFLSTIKNMATDDIIDFSIPRHNVEWNADLKDYLEKSPFSFTAPFDKESYDQFGELTSDTTASIDFIKHRAEYTVIEKGAEMSAAQATSVTARCRSPKTPTADKTVKFDRPFVMVWIVQDMVVGVAMVTHPKIVYK